MNTLDGTETNIESHSIQSLAAVIELANLMQQRMSDFAADLSAALGKLQKTEITDYTDRYKTALDSHLRGNDASAGSEQSNNKDWITFTEAAEILGVVKGTVSKWARQGGFRDNGRKGQKRRLLKTSVLMIKQEIEDNDLKKDIRDLRQDARKLG